MSAPMGANRAFFLQLRKYYLWYTGGFLAFLVAIYFLEQAGLSREWIGYLFLFATIALYAGIGVMSRTADVAEYYVAGRRVPALFNGMATGADWMSAASFIGMAGGLYVQGFDGLAFILGWTGGYCLVAFLLAPYLRKFGQFTIPDFLGARYGGNVARTVGVVCAILCSFTYVVAQIYGVGIIVTRFTGIPFFWGVFAGLAGILVCSFLGGMRAVTWTQVAQYIILIIAYLLPVVMLSVKHGWPVPQVMYGQALEKVTDREQVLNGTKPNMSDAEKLAAAREEQVRDIYRQRAADGEARIKALPGSWLEGQAALKKRVDALKLENAAAFDIRAAVRRLDAYPKSPEDAKKLWQREIDLDMAHAAPIVPHGEPFYSAKADPVQAESERDRKRRNFLALTLCLMLGTAALPHILMRYYTTPSVQEARVSVFWSLLFIFLLYFTAPALAVLVKFDVLTYLVGTEIKNLPAWVNAWGNIINPDGSRMFTITDINRDGIVQLAEIAFNQDIIVLAAPEIAGLPYVVSGLVAAGGLAAALSTADGLLLTIANALSHDVYYKMINPNASTQKRVTISKFLLLIVAIFAAWVSASAPATILWLVSAAFSLAAASFFAPLVFGIFWKRANKWGAVLSMICGVSVTFYYMAVNQPWLRSVFKVTRPVDLWFGIEPISAAIFGLPVAVVVLVVVSLLTPAPDSQTQELVEHVRYPNLKDDTVKTVIDGERRRPTE